MSVVCPRGCRDVGTKFSKKQKLSVLRNRKNFIHDGGSYEGKWVRLVSVDIVR